MTVRCGDTILGKIPLIKVLYPDWLQKVEELWEFVWALIYYPIPKYLRQVKPSPGRLTPFNRKLNTSEQSDWARLTYRLLISQQWEHI